jgi:hypothetical protein
MKIVEIRDAVAPITSAIRNAYIDFSMMTASVVAIITDVIRDGCPVIGYGFNSNGRYGSCPSRWCSGTALQTGSVRPSLGFYRYSQRRPHPHPHPPHRTKSKTGSRSLRRTEMARDQDGHQRMN